MKTSFPEQIAVVGSRRITVLACCMALLPTSVHLAHGGTGFSQMGGTNVYNFYAYNGTTSTADGTALEPTYSGLPVPYINYFLPSPFTGTIPLTGQKGVVATVISGSSGFAQAIFLLGNTSSGANPTGLNPSGVNGLTLQLNNPNSAADEVRLDWNAIYAYSGTSSTTLGASGSPLSVIISGFLSASGSFYALAGGETLYDGANTSTATIGAGTAPGDNFTVSGSVLGTGPWNGAVASGTTYYFNIPTAPFSSGGLTVNPGDVVTVKGYMDLVVDPGSIQVQLSILQPPQLGITTYSNSPVVFFPTVPGTNFVLQTTSDLTSSNWVTVTNGIPISGIIITNATSPAFFRLN